MYALPIKALAHTLSNRGGSPRLGVLTYHRVLPTKDALRTTEPTAASFEAELALLKKSFVLLRLDHAIELLYSNQLPRRALALTFDDGYKDNHDIALPILQRHGVQATFFVATGFMDGGAMFNDIVIESIRNAQTDHVLLPWDESLRLELQSIEAKRLAISTILPAIKKFPLEQRDRFVKELTERLRSSTSERLMMKPDEVLALHRAGMEIGGHTVRHPILLSLSDDEAGKEIAMGKRALEELINEPLTGFAYPNGRPRRDYDSRHPRMVEQAGFKYAVSTAWGSANRASSRFEVPRVAPASTSPAMFALRVAGAYRD